ARPLLRFLAALLLGLVSDRLLPLPFPVPRIDLVHWIIAGSLILIGLALAAAGIRNFSRAGTPVPTNRPARALVTTGIHGWIRNPIYLGMFLERTWNGGSAARIGATRPACAAGCSGRTRALTLRVRRPM